MFTKDDACNWVCCGLVTDERTGKDKFLPGMGCGRQWCFECGKRLCGQMFVEDEATGQVAKTSAPTYHNEYCCRQEAAALGVDYESTYCPGGHDSHK